MSQPVTPIPAKQLPSSAGGLSVLSPICAPTLGAGKVSIRKGTDLAVKYGCIVLSRFTAGYDQKGFVSRCGEDMARLKCLLVAEFSSPASLSAPDQQPSDGPGWATPLRPVLSAIFDLGGGRQRSRSKEDDSENLHTLHGVRPRVRRAVDDGDRAGGIPAEYLGSSRSGPSLIGYRMTANNTGASSHSRPFSIKNVKLAIPTRDQLLDR